MVKLKLCRMNFDVLNRQSLQYHPRSGGHCINQFGFVADGTVLILATLFNLVEKFAGTSGGICEGVEENVMHNVRRAGHWFLWKGQGYFQVFLG